MSCNILEHKQKYIDLVNFSSSLENLQAKRQELFSLAKKFDQEGEPSSESFFIIGFLGLEEPNATAADIEYAISCLKKAATQGHVEAGIALYTIYDGHYPWITNHTITRNMALDMLDHAVAQDHPYAHFLKALHYSKPLPQDKEGDPLQYKNETKAFEHLDKMKAMNYIGAYYLGGIWLMHAGPGANSYILAKKSLEEGLKDGVGVDIFSRYMVPDIHLNLARIFHMGYAGSKDEEKAAFHAAEAFKLDNAVSVSYLKEYELEIRIEIDGVCVYPEAEGTDDQTASTDSESKSPLRFFADPTVPKKIHYNHAPPEKEEARSFSNTSPIIEDGANGYSTIRHPEDKEYKPPVRVRISYAEDAHKAMRDKIASMETLDDETIAELLRPLDEMPGLTDIKKNISELVKFAYVMKRRKDLGLKNRAPNLHMIFSGNPGTGKTHVARLVSHVFYQIGLLDSGHMIEAQRNDLTGEYIGWSESKTNLVCQASFGGVLFLDEAYSLTDSSFGNDFGPEVMATLLKMMEDFSDRFVVIAAGYKDKMEAFVRSNPGLRSRFGHTIDFRNYTAEEMARIFDVFARDYDYAPTEEARAKVLAVLKALKGNEYDRFGNARGVRNLFDQIIRRQSLRIVRDNLLDVESLSEIRPDDIPSAKALENGTVTYLPTER